MKNLNTKTVAELATALKVEPAKLSEQLMTDKATEAEMTTTISSELSGLTIMPKMDFDTLVENKGRAKYNEGKIAEREMTIKEMKKEFGVTAQVDTVKDLFQKTLEIEKTKLGTPADERVKKLEDEKTTLQGLIQQKEAELVKKNGEIEQVRTGFTLNGEIEKAANSISIDAPAEKVSAQRDILVTMFKQKHEVKIEDGKQVVYRDGKLLKDNLLNPVSVADALAEFAPAYVTVKAKVKGRGDNADDTQLSAELGAVKDRAGFEALMSKKGITNYASPEAIAIYRELKAKNPALQF